MRHRRLLAALPLFLLVAAPSMRAQDVSLFDNSWFWGVHAGSTSIGTPAQSANAATIGGEWMITRSTGGLYVAYDQANFTGSSAIVDNAAVGGLRSVSISDMRTVSLAAVAFPFHSSGFRPYAGLGVALSLIGSATAQGDTVGATVNSDVVQRVNDAKSRSSAFVMGGAQWQIRRTAIFAQVTAMPSNANFLVTKPVTTITGGVRYNFGTSIDR
jgi:hypothetical protein